MLGRTPPSAAEGGRGEAKNHFHCSFLCLCGASHGRSSHLSFKLNKFAKVKDEDCQLLCTRVCCRFALALVLPGSLAGGPATTMRRKGSAYCSGYSGLCLALVPGLTFFFSVCREGSGSECVVGKEVGFLLLDGRKPSETALSCVGRHRVGEVSVSESSVASSQRPVHAGLAVTLLLALIWITKVYRRVCPHLLAGLFWGRM